MQQDVMLSNRLLELANLDRRQHAMHVELPNDRELMVKPGGRVLPSPRDCDQNRRVGPSRVP